MRAKSFGRRALQVGLPIIVLLGAGAWAGLLVSMAPDPQQRPPQTATGPLVRAMTVTVEPRRVEVVAEGVVEPWTSSAIASEVAGRVTWVSPALIQGTQFEEGDELVRIEDRRYVLAVARAQQALDAAELALATERAQRDAALRDWRALGRTGDPPPLQAREPQLRQAESNREAALQALRDAEVDRERTVLRAPFDGGVRERLVEIGEYVSPGTPVARIFSIDASRVRLPLRLEQQRLLDLLVNPTGAGQGPMDRAVSQRDLSAGRSNAMGGEPTDPPAAPGTDRLASTVPTETEPRLPVELRLAGEPDSPVWLAAIDYVEREIDARTQVMFAVARIDRPYDGETPLLNGRFVEATIVGPVRRVAIIPRGSLVDLDGAVPGRPEGRPEEMTAGGAPTSNPQGQDAQPGRYVLVAGPADPAETAAFDREQAERTRTDSTPALSLGAIYFVPVRVLRYEGDRVWIAGGLATGDRVLLSSLQQAVEGMTVRVKAVDADGTPISESGERGANGDRRGGSTGSRNGENRSTGLDRLRSTSQEESGS
mgnify:CR=1 FL=1